MDLTAEDSALIDRRPGSL